MPSIQTALPPELADNVIRLYRECLRRARFIGHRQHNTDLIVSMVRQQFKKHKNETDPEKIQKLKDESISKVYLHSANVLITWIRPPVGEIMLNVGAFRSTTVRAGGGGELRID